MADVGVLKIAGGVALGLLGFTIVVGLAARRVNGSAVGKTAIFPVNEQSVDVVEETTLAFMIQEAHAPEVNELASRILESKGISNFDSDFARGAALHRFVADEVPYKDDPHGFEKIISPAEHSRILLKSGPEGFPGSDCDDTALLLAALATSQGIPSSVAYLDTNHDGDIDHAITIMVLGGRPTFAETTMQGVDLGWCPPSSIVEVLDLS